MLFFIPLTLTLTPPLLPRQLELICDVKIFDSMRVGGSRKSERTENRRASFYYDFHPSIEFWVGNFLLMCLINKQQNFHHICNARGVNCWKVFCFPLSLFTIEYFVLESYENNICIWSTNSWLTENENDSLDSSINNQNNWDRPQWTSNFIRYRSEHLVCIFGAISLEISDQTHCMDPWLIRIILNKSD